MGCLLHQRALRVLCRLAVAAAWLAPCSTLHGQKPTLQDQISAHEKKLAAARAEHSDKATAAELCQLGRLYVLTKDEQAGVNYLEQAVPIEEAIGDRSGEATTLKDIGRVYSNLTETPKALDYYNRALEVARAAGDRRVEGQILNNIGWVDRHLGRAQEALSFYDQAATIWRDVPDPGGEGTTLSGRGAVYSDLGQKEKALKYFNQALPMCKQAADHTCEIDTLNHIGWAYDLLGQKAKAIRYYAQALALCRSAGDRRGEAQFLNNIGWSYQSTGEYQRALAYLGQALPIARAVGDRNIAASTLDSLGLLYRHAGNYRKALTYYRQALPLESQGGMDADEIYTMWGMGDSESALGDDKNALRNDLAALSLAKEMGDPDSQGGVDSSLMTYFSDRKQPETAIFFGTEAVNSFQQIRKNISGLDPKVQLVFAKSKSSIYRQLAELLIQMDRLGEAEHVLDLLKEQEFKEVVRGAPDDAAAKVAPVQLTAAQQKAQIDLNMPEETARTLTALGLEYATLLAKQKRLPEEDARLKELDAKIEDGNAELSDFLRNTFFPELAQAKGVDDANAALNKEKLDVSDLQKTLAQLGPRVIGIRILLGEAHVYAIVVTAQSRQKVELKTTPGELRSKVLEARDALRTPRSDPKPQLQELYAMMIAPLEPSLKALEAGGEAQAGVPTLLWSLDGVLRYLPMAALYNGKTYLAERFKNVLFTPESYGSMSPPAGANPAAWQVLAMGLTKSYGGLPALPGVLPELESVVRDPAVPASHGPLEGRLLPDEQFTLAALKEELGSGKSFAVVHIASHFVLETGSDKEPYLMLGGNTTSDAAGYALTLSKLEDSTVSFHGTQLLTLSACSTARGEAAQNGREMDSLDMLAQRKDAAAVLATVWDVNDASTSRLMGDFYARWMNDPKDGKAEALRQAQLALLHGAPAASETGRARGPHLDEEAPPAHQTNDYSHPYYWAPFVLVGNFQ